MEALVGRDYITTAEWTVDELKLAVEWACDLKHRFRAGEPTRLLVDKTIFLLFFDLSTRTRNAFEAGATQLGAHAHFIDVSTSQIAHGEVPKDTGIILSSYGHGIAVRHDTVPGEGEAYMREMAKWADVPLINLQSDVDHPTQTLADLMTLYERHGSWANLHGLDVAVSWAYAPSYAKPLSVPQGLIWLLTRFGCNVTLAHPPDYGLMEHTVQAAKDNAAATGGSFRVVNDMDEAFRDADVVYPKSWGALHLFSEPDAAERLASRHTDWICDARRMALASPEAVYMHCLPADRGNEVTDEVIDGPQSVVFSEAENRLHTAKSLMSLTMR
jgi:ornithine carbamoyltransferase